MDVKKSEIAEEISRASARNAISLLTSSPSVPDFRKAPFGTCFRKAPLRPTAPMLKICEGLGLTIPQFFDRSSFLEKLPTEEKELMSIYLKLDQKDRDHLVAYARKLIAQNEKETTL